jgi:response regulator RpfG family c-di-GMP phosphodiesterase
MRRDGGGHFPVLVLTADVAIEARRRALAADATDFVVKPIDSVEVVMRAAQRGRQFDPDLVDAFLTLDPSELLDPVGSPVS